MNIRFWLVLVLGSVLVAPAACVLAVRYHEQRLIDQDPIRYDKFEMILDGMTQNQVEELLGCPSGNYGGTSVGTKMTAGPPGDHCRHWQGPRGTITVIFRDGKVWMRQLMRLVAPNLYSDGPT